MSAEFVIRPVRESDHAQWRALWQGYLDFYRMTVPGPVTEQTWRRFLDPEFPVHALCADNGEGRLLGVTHYLFHYVTAAIGPRCYLQDLFTVPEARGQGVGRALIEAVYAAADTRGADQVYWLTATDNATARALYDRVAQATSFIKYRR